MNNALVVITISYVLGIFCGYWQRIELFFCIFLLGVVLIFLKRANFFRIGLLCLLVLSFGYFYTQSRLVENFPVKIIFHQPFQLEGIVISLPTQRVGLRGQVTSFYCRLTKMGDQNITANVLVNLYREDKSLFYGDKILFQAKLSNVYNFSKDSNFSYTDYLARQGVYKIAHVSKKYPVKVLAKHQGNRIVEISLKMRQYLSAIYDRYLSMDDSAMMKAFVLGDRSAIDGNLKKIFVETGTAHILAISGLNVSIVAYLIMIILRIFCWKRTLRYLLTIVAVIFYCLMTGSTASVVRATIMSVVFLLSFLLERENDSWTTFCCAGFIILLIDPRDLFDIGFQLSFICVAAILYCSKFLKNFDQQKSWIRQFLFEPLIVSICVWISVVGLIVYYFKIVTPITIVANLVIVPLSSLLVILGSGLLLMSFLNVFLVNCFVMCIKLSLWLLVFFVNLFHHIPNGYFYMPRLTLIWIIGYYLLMTCGILVSIKAKNVKNHLNDRHNGFTF